MGRTAACLLQVTYAVPAFSWLKRMGIVSDMPCGAGVA